MVLAVMMLMMVEVVMMMVVALSSHFGCLPMDLKEHSSLMSKDLGSGMV